MIVSEVNRDAKFLFGENRIYCMGDAVYKVGQKAKDSNLFYVWKLSYQNGQWKKSPGFYVLGTRPITIVE